jgi:hypothetical protein
VGVTHLYSCLKKYERADLRVRPGRPPRDLQITETESKNSGTFASLKSQDINLYSKFLKDIKGKVVHVRN